MSYDFTNKHVFVSGPIAGEPYFNAEWIDAVKAWLYELGAATVWTPIALTPLYGHDEQTHEGYMMPSLHALTSFYRDEKQRVRRGMDVVVLMPEWAYSEGARTEWEVAKACGIDIVEWEDVA